MGIIIRQSLKTTIFTYIGVLIGLVNRLFFLPNFLTLEQLGLVDVLILIATVISTLSFFGAQPSIVKFFPYFKKQKKELNFVGFFLLVSLLGYAVLGGLFYFFREVVIGAFPNDVALLSQYYYFIFPLIFLFNLRGIFTIYSTSNMRITVPSIMNDVVLKLFTAILLLLIGYHFITFDNYIVLLLFTYLLIVLTLISYCTVNFKFKLNFNLKAITKIEYKKVFSYSLFVYLAGISGLVSQFTDTLMLASIKGFNVSGIYSIAFFIGMSIEIPKRAITSITGVVIAKHWEENNQKEINKLYKQSSINQGVIGGFLFLLVVININEIFYILPKSDILSAGKNVAIIIGLSRFIDMITGVNNEILRTSHHYKIDLYAILFFIGVSIISNLILIPIIGINGAAFATLISVFLYNFVRYIVLKRLYQFEPFTLKTFQFLIVLL